MISAHKRLVHFWDQHLEDLKKKRTELKLSTTPNADAGKSHIPGPPSKYFVVQKGRRKFHRPQTSPTWLQPTNLLPTLLPFPTTFSLQFRPPTNSRHPKPRRGPHGHQRARAEHLPRGCRAGPAAVFYRFSCWT